MLLPEEEVDPMMVKAKLAASEDMAKITFFHKISDLKDAMKSQLIGSQRVGFIIDAQTSRQKVTIGFLEFYLRGGPPGFLLLQRRADCLGISPCKKCRYPGPYPDQDVANMH